MYGLPLKWWIRISATSKLIEIWFRENVILWPITMHSILFSLACEKVKFRLLYNTHFFLSIEWNSFPFPSLFRLFSFFLPMSHNNIMWMNTFYHNFIQQHSRVWMCLLLVIGFDKELCTHRYAEEEKKEVGKKIIS